MLRTKFMVQGRADGDLRHLQYLDGAIGRAGRASGCEKDLGSEDMTSARTLMQRAIVNFEDW